jgi:hypothetical protein
MDAAQSIPIARIAVTAIVAGALGGAAMIGVMRLITRAEWAKFDMIVALGSLVTGSRQHAFRVGLILHTISAIVFATLYTLAMWKTGLAHFPIAAFACTGIGIVHGMVVSILLVWIISEHHPLEEFKEADLAIALVHFAGHVAYGAVVGLVIGIISF